jgi:CelD/BcsL family acetyltransferase involved in cellulose biosynthesis
MTLALFVPEVPRPLSATTTRYDIEHISVPLPALNVSLVEDAHTFARLRPEWNALVERTRNEPFYRHEFIRSWIENFSPEAPLKLLIGRESGGRLVAILPLIEERIRLFGIPVRQWTSPTNVHSERFDLVAEDRKAASEAFFAHLRTVKDWDLLRMTEVPPGGNAWAFHQAARDNGFPVGVYESQRSVYIPLTPSFEALQSTLGGKFRGNLRRRRKLLEAKGNVSVDCIPGGPDLQARLEECFAIEQSGKKATYGEPANLNPSIHGFYSTLAWRASKEGSFLLYRLLLDGRPIAFHYGLQQNGIYSLLMTSYDESLRDCSPGHLLVEEVLKRCIETGQQEFDFLGCDLDWKRAWGPTSRQHVWLFVFRNNLRGHFLHGMKFKVSPAAKRLMAFWRKGKS